MTINHYFFELIQVAIGMRICLSHTPSADEWGELYAMAKKQSLVGVCFAGVQKLVNQRQEPPEMLYLTWMGMAAKIQQRNEAINKHCVELQAKLSADGFNSCILKGQGIAQLYPENLSGLRQSGDIDVWIDAHMTDIVRYARKVNPNAHFDYLHVNLDMFDSTEVEAHYRPGCMYNLRMNRKLQKWFLDNKQTQTLSLADGEIVVPSVEFNLFYILHHSYRHLINGGIGLRQVMDWYFVLKSRNNTSTGSVQAVNDDDNDNFLSLLKQFGMMRFAKAVMWVVAHVFANENISTSYFDSAQHKSAQAENENLFLGIAPDETEGRFLLNEIMMGGNFGHHDSRKEKHKVNESRWAILVRKIKTNMHLLAHYPSEVLSAPIYFVWHYYWKKKQINSLQ